MNPVGLKQSLRDNCHISPSMSITNPRALPMVFTGLLKSRCYSRVSSSSSMQVTRQALISSPAVPLPKFLFRRISSTPNCYHPILYHILPARCRKNYPSFSLRPSRSWTNSSMRSSPPLKTPLPMKLQAKMHSHFSRPRPTR